MLQGHQVVPAWLAFGQEQTAVNDEKLAEVTNTRILIVDSAADIHMPMPT